MNWFWKGMYCLVVLGGSLLVSFLLCVFFLLSFWWMLVIIPIDVWIIWRGFREWAKEKAEEEKKEIAYYKATAEQD